MADTLSVLRVQRNTAKDGDGVRTSIFLKGCPLRCAWCHSPESQSFAPELIFFEERCTGCGKCAAVCPAKAIAMPEKTATVSIITSLGDTSSAFAANVEEVGALQAEAAAYQATADAISEEAEALQTEAEAFLAEAEAFQEQAFAVPTEAEAFLAKAKAVSTEAKAFHERAKAVYAKAEAFQTKAEAYMARAAAILGRPGASQIRDIITSTGYDSALASPIAASTERDGSPMSAVATSTVPGESPEAISAPKPVYKARPDRERCAGCGACVDACDTGARERAGKPWTIDELMTLIRRDAPFYETSGGGVTLTGGEPLAQDMDALVALLMALHEEGISVAIDTCGYAPWAHFARILPYVDYFLYDVKYGDGEAHRLFTGEDNARILDNLARLGRGNAAVDICVPVIGGVNAQASVMEAIADAIADRVKPRRIRLLPYHDADNGKFASLSKPYSDVFFAPDDASLAQISAIFTDKGFAVTLIDQSP